MAQAWNEVIFERAFEAPVLSAEEWLALPEDDTSELVDGSKRGGEVPDAIHELAVTWLIALLRAWLGGSGFVFGSGMKLLLAEDLGRMPDVTVLLPGTAKPPRRGPLRSPPDIVVEVVTPSPRDERRDRIEKMSEYAAFGVPNYWLLDPALGSFEVFTLAEGTYRRAVVATKGTVANVPQCEGLQLPLDDLWSELMRLEE